MRRSIPFVHGDPYSRDSNLGLLADVSRFTFDWQIASDSVSSLDPDATPALRLHLGQRRPQRADLGRRLQRHQRSTDEGVWYSTGSGDKFWRFVTCEGVTFDESARVNLTIADCIGGKSSALALVVQRWRRHCGNQRWRRCEHRRRLSYLRR